MPSLKAFALAALVAMATSGGVLAQDQAVYSSRDGVVLPSVVKQVKPQYTKDGMQLGIQGTVVLSTVVLADGTVGEVKVERSLDSASGLDQAAVDALKQWLFKPGTKDGKPVAVQVSIEISFRLK